MKQIMTMGRIVKGQVVVYTPATVDKVQPVDPVYKATNTVNYDDPMLFARLVQEAMAKRKHR